MESIYKIFFLSAILVLSIVGCSEDKKSSSADSVQNTVNQLGNANNIGENTRSYSSYTYTTLNGNVDESIFLRVLWSKDHKISILSIKVNGVERGKGSYFDNANTYVVDEIGSQSSQTFLNLYQDSNRSNALWDVLKKDFDGAQYILLEGFSHSELAPFQTSDDKAIPIEITIEVDGRAFQIQDQINVPGTI